MTSSSSFNFSLTCSLPNASGINEQSTCFPHNFIVLGASLYSQLDLNFLYVHMADGMQLHHGHGMPRMKLVGSVEWPLTGVALIVNSPEMTAP